jgi:TMEM175 potassium channel family protein
MARDRTRRRENVSTRRLEAYTDGIFAIAATLLVLDLSIDGFGAVKSDQALWDALVGLRDHFTSFVISFLLLCLLWVVHTRQFEHVRRVDSTVLTLNSLRLLAVVLIPFTTSINSAYNALPLGRALMPANFFVVILFGSMQWFYLTAQGRGMVEGMSEERVRATRWANVTVIVVGAGVVALAPFIGSWAFGLFVVTGPIETALMRRDSRRHQAGSPNPTTSGDGG